MNSIYNLAHSVSLIVQFLRKGISKFQDQFRKKRINHFKRDLKVIMNNFQI